MICTLVMAGRNLLKPMTCVWVTSWCSAMKATWFSLSRFLIGVVVLRSIMRLQVDSQKKQKHRSKKIKPLIMHQRVSSYLILLTGVLILIYLSALYWNVSGDIPKGVDCDSITSKLKTDNLECSDEEEEESTPF